MKNKIMLLISLSVLTFAPTVAQASDTDLCPKIGELAETIMRSRQSGVSMSSMMAMTDDTAIGKLASSMIKMAFEEPRYQSQEFKRKSEEDFRAKTERLCYE